MGKNYYRIPKSDDVNRSYQKFMSRLQEMDRWNPSMILNGYRFIEDTEDDFNSLTPWDEFIKDMSIHLGKASMGWKFCWNFHDGEYYKNKEELLSFIRDGKVVDEYGQPIESEEFIEMSLSWGGPDGWVADKSYFESMEPNSFLNNVDYYDKEIDGLRVSSSTEFT